MGEYTDRYDAALAVESEKFSARAEALGFADGRPEYDCDVPCRLHLHLFKPVRGSLLVYSFVLNRSDLRGTPCTCMHL